LHLQAGAPCRAHNNKGVRYVKPDPRYLIAGYFIENFLKIYQIKPLFLKAVIAQ
jgi:hypothetical protein